MRAFCCHCCYCAAVAAARSHLTSVSASLHTAGLQLLGKIDEKFVEVRAR